MYLLAGLAVGGTWPGDPNATTVFPAEFKIDYIRAYALTTSPAIDPSATATIKGTAGGDRLTDTAASDILWGGTGGDRFVFTNGGKDIILDVDPKATGEVIEISKALAGVKNFTQLYKHMVDTAAGDVLIKLAGSHTITLEGVHKAQLTSGDILLI